MTQAKSRVWELDALRGICILGMIVVHFFYDIYAFTEVELQMPRWFDYLQQYGHLFFVLISGICAAMAGRSFQRGVYVFAAGLLISWVTLFMEHVLGFYHLGIWFGILHMLGMCMMLYPLFRKLPIWLVAALALAFVGLGFWMNTIRVGVDFLFPLGLRSGKVFTGSDFFPLFPGLGWFLVGAVLGRTVYAQRKSLLPKVNANNRLLRFFRFCGRHSLEIYLVHQPIITGIVILVLG